MHCSIQFQSISGGLSTLMRHPAGDGSHFGMLVSTNETVSPLPAPSVRPAKRRLDRRLLSSMSEILVVRSLYVACRVWIVTPACISVDYLPACLFVDHLPAWTFFPAFCELPCLPVFVLRLFLLIVNLTFALCLPPVSRLPVSFPPSVLTNTDLVQFFLPHGRCFYEFH